MCFVSSMKHPLNAVCKDLSAVLMYTILQSYLSITNSLTTSAQNGVNLQNILMQLHSVSNVEFSKLNNSFYAILFKKKSNTMKKLVQIKINY